MEVLFNSPVFITLFLPVTLLGYACLTAVCGRVTALCWLLAASLYFYAWWNPPFVVLLIASILGNFAIGARLRAPKNQRLWLVFGLSVDLALLGFFKYATFLCVILRYHPRITIFLPLGISFFTFQQIMFLVDSYWGDLAAPSFLEYACFIAFFPHLIAGPIVRPGHIIPQFRRDLAPGAWLNNIISGLETFLLGLAKKLVMADGFARFADPGFAAAARHDPLTLIEAWVALLAYALQIYFDFSGYSDMAIGLARMFGIGFPENFNSPYRAADISDFWRRWNITLGAFLRDYVYIPLGGNRVGNAHWLGNLMITMLLGGLWHGAGVKFIVWGGLHGIYLCLHGIFQKLCSFRLPVILAWPLTILAVLLAWVPFRAANWSSAMNFYQALFGGNGIALPSAFIHTLPVLQAIAHPVPVLPYLGDARTLSLPQAMLFLGLGWFIVLALPNLPKMSQAFRRIALISSFALTVQALFFAPYRAPFLYFQF
jgi:D-alanyl-lipoteichoic acid acyltransferase DltB (MBOAT superfamily)